jgi:hypothetical protein
LQAEADDAQNECRDGNQKGDPCTELGMFEIFPFFKGLGDGGNSFVSDFQGSIKGD